MTTSNKVEQFYNTLVKDPELDIKPGQTREQAARMEANYRARQYDNNSKALAMATTPDESPINSLFNHLEQMKKSSDDIVLIKQKTSKPIGGYDSQSAYYHELEQLSKFLSVQEIKKLTGKKAETFAKNLNTYFDAIELELRDHDKDDVTQIYEQFKNPNPFPFEKPPTKERLKSLRENGYVEGTGKNIKLTARGASHFLNNRRLKNSKSFKVPNAQSNFKLVNLNDSDAFNKARLKPGEEYSPSPDDRKDYIKQISEKFKTSEEDAEQWINQGKFDAGGSSPLRPTSKGDYDEFIEDLGVFYDAVTANQDDKKPLKFTSDIKDLHESFLKNRIDGKSSDNWLSDNEKDLNTSGLTSPFESGTGEAEEVTSEASVSEEPKAEPKAGQETPKTEPQKTEAELRAEKQAKLKEDLPNSMNTLISEATKYFEKQGGSSQNLSLLNAKIESGTELTQNDFSLFRNTLTNLKGEVGEGRIVRYLGENFRNDLNNYQDSMKPEASADGPLISDEPINFEQLEEDLKAYDERQAKLKEEELKGAANKAHKDAIDNIFDDEKVKPVLDQMYKDKYTDDPVITPEKFAERLKSKYYKDETGGVEALENLVSDAFQKNKKDEEKSGGDDADNIKFINDKFKDHEADYRHAYEKKYGLDEGDQAEHLKFDDFKDILLNKYKNNKNGFLEETQKYNTEKIKAAKKKADEEQKNKQEETQEEIQEDTAKSDQLKENLQQAANSSIAVDKNMLDWAQNKGQFKGKNNDTKKAATLLLKKHLADYVALKNQGLLNEKTDAVYMKTTAALKELGANTDEIKEDIDRLGTDWGNTDYINQAEQKFSGKEGTFFSDRGPIKQVQEISNELKEITSDLDDMEDTTQEFPGDAIPVDNRGYITPSSPAPEGVTGVKTKGGALVYDKTKVQAKDSATLAGQRAQAIDAKITGAAGKLFGGGSSDPTQRAQEIDAKITGAVGKIKPAISGAVGTAAKVGAQAGQAAAGKATKVGQVAADKATKAGQVAAKGAKAVKTQVSESVGADVARATVEAGKAGAKRVSNVRQGKTGSGADPMAGGATPPKTEPERKLTQEDVPSFAGEVGKVNPGGPKKKPTPQDAFRTQGAKPKRSKRQAFTDLFKADDIENPEGLARWLAAKYDGVPTTTKPGEPGWERIQTYLTALKDPSTQERRGKVNRTLNRKTGKTNTGALFGSRKKKAPQSHKKRAQTAMQNHGWSYHDASTNRFKATNKPPTHSNKRRKAGQTVADKRLGPQEDFNRKYSKRVKRTMEQAKKINKQMPSNELIHKQRQDILERLEKLV